MMERRRDPSADLRMTLEKFAQAAKILKRNSTKDAKEAFFYVTLAFFVVNSNRRITDER